MEPRLAGRHQFPALVHRRRGHPRLGRTLCRRLRTRRRALNPITDALAVSLAATLATAPLVSHTFGIVPLAGVVVNPAAILLGSVVVLAGALWMLLPVGWAAPAFECVLSHTAEGLNAGARHGGSALHCGGIRPRRRGDGGRLPLFHARNGCGVVRRTEKSVHLPA
ncbi:MAG: ComEC/Rec2 family competence protein [Alistipes sp.]